MGTPVSGPGQFSKRTDKAVGEANRSLPNADYGEQASYQSQLQGAPVAQTAPDLNSMFGNAAANVVGLGADTTRPDEPVTAGAALGPGPGMEAIAGADADSTQQKLQAYLPALLFMADNGNSDSARNLVRQIQAMTFDS